MDWATMSSQLWEFALGMLKAATFVGVVAAVLFFLFLYLFRKAQNSPDSPIDVSELFIDSQTGKMSRRAVGELVGLFVSTLALLYFLATDNEIIGENTRLYAFMFYTLIWVARSLVGAFLQMKFGGGGAAAADPEDPEPMPRARKRATKATATLTVETPQGVAIAPAPTE